MKRNARRAVLIAALAAGAGFVQTAPASAENVCAFGHVWVGGGQTSVGQCVSTPVDTTCTGQDIKPNGVGYYVCVPLP